MTELGRVRWPHLFSPLQVGPLTLPNRIVMPAMDPSLADAEGLPTPAMVSHYALRAAGGAGLVITGNVAVHPRGRLSPWMATLTSDRHTEAFAGLANAVHAVGGRLFVQLSHAGRQTVSQFAGGQPLSASAVPCPVMRDPPRAMDEAEVEETLEAFAAAALRARDSGADGVEFHMAHGYLVCQFLSPYSNFRDDRWGVSRPRWSAAPARSWDRVSRSSAGSAPTNGSKAASPCPWPSSTPTASCSRARTRSR